MSTVFVTVQTRGAAWMAGRTARERVLVVSLAIVAAIVLFVVLIWRPLQASRAAAQEEIRTYDALIAQLHAAGPRLAAQGSRRNGPISAIITDTAAEAGLTIRRLDPDGTHTRITFDDVDFEHLVRWLDAVERSGRLKVDDLKMERRPAPGVINAQITLVGG